MPQTQLKARSSKLQRIMACPASLQAEAPYPYTSSPAAERGRKLHEAMALLVQTKGQGLRKINEAWASDPEAVNALLAAWQAGQALMPADPALRLAAEEPLDATFLGLASAKPDLVCYAPTHKGAVLIDWKFGQGEVEDPLDNRQLQAYAACLFRKDTELQAVDAAIVQPLAWKEDDRARLTTWTREGLRPMAQEIKAAVELAKGPNPPYRASKDACRFCLHAGACAAGQALKAELAEAKAEKETAALATVTEGTPICANSEPIQTPMVVISAEIVAQAEDLQRQAQGLKVTDGGTAEAAGRMVKSVRGLHALIDKNREKVKAPVLALGRAIDAAAKQALDPLKAAADRLEKEVGAYFAEEQRKINEARALELRKQQQAQAEAENARRAAEKALQQAQEAKTKAQREAAAKAAQEAARMAAEAAKTAAEATEATAALSVPAPTVTGFKAVEEIAYTIPDFSKIPAPLLQVFLQPNDKAIREAIAGQILSEADGWLQITRTTVAKGRR